MKIDREKKRLKSIKLKYALFPTKCRCCKEEYKREKMWHVCRYGVNATVHDWYYCQNCMHSAEDVLNEIDTDGVPFGIAFVDDFLFFEKKDNTRLNLALERCLPKKV